MEEMASRTFTLQDAQILLPTLESLLRTAINGKKLIEEVDAEMQELAHRIFLNGGTLVNVVAVARRRAERERAVQRAKDAVAEIHATGVQVKDIDIGLLDFPCRVEGEIFCSAGSSVNRKSRTGIPRKKASPDASPSTSASSAREKRSDKTLLVVSRWSLAKTRFVSGRAFRRAAPLREGTRL